MIKKSFLIWLMALGLCLAGCGRETDAASSTGSSLASSADSSLGASSGSSASSNPRSSSSSDSSSSSSSSQPLATYLITFINDDGTVLEEKEWKKGSMPSYSGKTPSKKADAQYTYSFSGWSPAITRVVSEATYTATFRSATNQYTITFADEDGTALESGKWDYGATPIYSGTLPTKEKDDQYCYDFSKWSPDIVPVVSDALYTTSYSSSPFFTFSQAENKPSFSDATTSFRAVSSTNLSVDFDCSSLSNALGCWGKIPSGGVLENSNAIPGLKRITITFGGANEISISYGWKKSVYDVKDRSLKASKAGDAISFDFGSDFPSFFRICGQSSITLITNILLTYTGTVTQNPNDPGTEGLKMSLSQDKTFYIVQRYNGTSTDVVINPSYLHLPVKEIADDAFWTSSLRSISIPYSVTCIPAGFINSCDSLQGVTVDSENPVYKVENYFLIRKSDSVLVRFTNFDVAEATIPLYATAIGDGAFKYCRKLAKVEIPSSVTSIGTAAFNGCGLTEIVIPSSVTDVGRDAFTTCTSLESVVLSPNLTSIAEWTFYYCESLKSIVIPESVTSIGKSAFEACSGLKSVCLPSSLKNVYENAFYQCDNFASVEVASIESFCAIHFANRASHPTGPFLSLLMKGVEVKDLIIPSSVTAIGDYTFRSFHHISSVSIPSSVTSIGSYAFFGCSSLLRVSIPPLATRISEYTFMYCFRLADVTIPSSVTEIRDYAFSNCSALTHISIPSSVKKIYSYAFEKCSSLTEIAIPSSVSYLGSNVFESCSSLKNVTLPPSMDDISYCAFRFCTSLVRIDIPSSVTRIRDGAFAGCSSLVQMDFSSSVTIIDSCAFSNCSSLQRVSIPSSVKSLGEDAFSGCPNCTVYFESSSVPKGWRSSWGSTKAFVLDSSTRDVMSNGDYSFGHNWTDKFEVFAYSGTAAALDLPAVALETNVEGVAKNFLRGNTSVTSVRIPDGYVQIEQGAFSNCSALKTIIIGSGVASIGSGAFAGCGSIEACYYKGTPEQWSALNFTTFGPSVAFYSETDMSGATGHYYWHYAADGMTPVLWNA